MNLPFELPVLQYVIVVVAALGSSIALGLKRGWRGQLMAFVPIVAVWGLLGVERDALVNSINLAYKGLRFFLSCGSQADTAACMEATGISQATLVNPANPDQVRLLLLIAFVSAVALVWVLVMRFGRRPASVLQRLLGVALGVANGFTLSYLVLPMLSYGQEISLPLTSSSSGGEPSMATPSLPVSLSVPGVSAGVLILALFVVFVIVAVRLMRPAET
jgi:hypothetical protein